MNLPHPGLFRDPYLSMQFLPDQLLLDWGEIFVRFLRGQKSGGDMFLLQHELLGENESWASSGSSNGNLSFNVIFFLIPLAHELNFRGLKKDWYSLIMENLDYLENEWKMSSSYLTMFSEEGEEFASICLKIENFTLGQTGGDYYTKNRMNLRDYVARRKQIFTWTKREDKKRFLRRRDYMRLNWNQFFGKIDLYQTERRDSSEQYSIQFPPVRREFDIENPPGHTYSTWPSSPTSTGSTATFYYDYSLTSTGSTATFYY